MNVSEADEKQIHDLITRIHKRSAEQEDDITNLYSLIHSCMGEGVRSPKYQYVDEKYREGKV